MSVYEIYSKTTVFGSFTQNKMKIVKKPIEGV